MRDITDKRDRSRQFRTRLRQAMSDARISQSALSRTVGIDRSTISQALSDDGPRLPGAQVIAACAETLGVSTDWLLGLSDRPESAQDLVAGALGFSPAARALIDDQIFSWHQEAQGYKIRHVPAGLPDMLKTPAMLEWEYTPHLGQTAAQAIKAAGARLDWMRGAQSDYEIALPVHTIHAFAGGTGYYADCPGGIRASQTERFMDIAEQLYPRLRLYFFDARILFSAPITIFGPLQAVLYSGSHYLTFRDRDRIETLTRHFDELVRQASVSAREVPAYLEALRVKIDT